MSTDEENEALPAPDFRVGYIELCPEATGHGNNDPHCAMSEQPERPYQESDLGSPEYRERLMRKLNCLIAVLEVANAKVRKSLTGHEPDLERLNRIQTNLVSTLEVCRRARRALERREPLPEGLPENLAAVVEQAKSEKGKALPRGAKTELTSYAERLRLERMGPIKPDELKGIDFDDLASKFQS